MKKIKTDHKWPTWRTYTEFFKIPKPRHSNLKLVLYIPGGTVNCSVGGNV